MYAGADRTTQSSVESRLEKLCIRFYCDGIRERRRNETFRFLKNALDSRFQYPRKKEVENGGCK